MKFKIKNSRLRNCFGGQVKFNISEQGMGIIEIVVVFAVMLTALAAILRLVALENRAQVASREEAAAYMIARETMEAARSVRDSDWTNLSTLFYSTRYYPVVNVNDQWELTSSNPGPVGIYTRSLEVEEVFRDSGTDDISTSGYSDADTRKIIVFVDWTTRWGDARTITLETYLTNWQAY